jgi:hypothetical protein
MRLLDKPVDLSKVHTIVYHLPDGDAFAVYTEHIDYLFELGFGEVCDTSEIDGVVHFFPRGNA